MPKILIVKESLSGVGGYEVHHDGMVSPYHVYDGMRKTPLALSLKSALEQWLKSNKPVTADEVKKEQEAQAVDFERLAAEQKAAADKKENELIEKIAKRYGLLEKSEQNKTPNKED